MCTLNSQPQDQMLDVQLPPKILWIFILIVALLSSLNSLTNANLKVEFLHKKSCCLQTMIVLLISPPPLIPMYFILFLPCGLLLDQSLFFFIIRNMMLNKVGVRGHPYLIPSFREKAFVISPLKH